MTKTTISSYLRDHLDDIGTKKEPGPYITISRQFPSSDGSFTRRICSSNSPKTQG
ncbi:MAG: hypothetical protein ACYSOJ_00850 [Planctomycetota bacterium]